MGSDEYAVVLRTRQEYQVGGDYTMTLPIFTTEEDVQTITDYLSRRPTGATMDEAKAALESRVLDGRKLKAYLAWGLVTRDGDKIRLTGLGSQLSRATTETRPMIYAQVLRNIVPYLSALEWAFYQRFEAVTNVGVASHWYEHNKDQLGTASENTIKDMAVCFFRLCEAAGVGRLMVGRRGQPTRLEIAREALDQFIAETELAPKVPEPVIEKEVAAVEVSEVLDEAAVPVSPPGQGVSAPRVFISHSEDMAIVEQITAILEVADLKCEIAEEEETTAIPVPEKVLSAMRRCGAAAICVTADEDEIREDGTYGINQNVLIEIGAAFVLYDRRVVLVWDKRVAVPSNLQGLYRCEFDGEELSWAAGMKLVKAVNKFKAGTAA